MLRKILEKIEKLHLNAVPPDAKRVEGVKEKIFRIRVGDLRILYVVDHAQNTIAIIKIDRREQAYR